MQLRNDRVAVLKKIVAVARGLKKARVSECLHLVHQDPEEGQEGLRQLPSTESLRIDEVPEDCLLL